MSIMGDVASEGSFFTSFEGYLKKRVVLPFSFWWVVFLVLVLGVLSSLVLMGKQREVLETGARPRDKKVFMELVRGAAGRGDYELARGLYEKGKVLGVGASFNIEREVYPERYLRGVAGEVEEVLEDVPYWLDGVRILKEIYKRLGEKERVRELEKVDRWIEPR